MHILLLDHRMADRPCPELETLVAAIEREGPGRRVSVCSPAIGEPTEGLLATRQGWSIRLDQLPAGGAPSGWDGFLEAIASGRCSLSAAAAHLADTPLGLLREAVRRAVTRAVDETDVDVLFVAQAGLLVEFAIETGPPVAAHADGRDLTSLQPAGRLRDIVAAALSSCDLLAADSATTADRLGADWIEPDPERPVEIWPLAGSAERILSGCQTALARRFTP